MTRPLLIAGAGVAGLWAALHAAPRRVILLTGSKLGENASTGWAQGGVAAALGEDDSAALHAQDTLEAGAGLVNGEAARLLAVAGADEIRALDALGAKFERDADGRWALSREAAHSRHRVARMKGDQAGAGILAALIAAAKAAPHIEIRESWRAESLLSDTDGGCAGILARRPDGRLEPVEADETILALGSLCGLYGVTTVPFTSQGKALVMAARLGAVIEDPEFVQFHPTAIDVGRDPAPLATEALRGEGAILIDAKGHRFMRQVHPDAELAPRDVVARAVHRQVRSGRGAFLDCTRAVGAAFPDHFPAVFTACMDAGIDPRTTPIPVAPAAHYHMGGIATDLDGFTGVSGLYAVGECASTGVHGANRLASNSLLDGLVFGRRAALACRTSTRRAGPALAAEPGRDLPPLALQRLRQMMAREAGVERDRTGLMRALALIDELEARHSTCDALVAARFVIHGALARDESRGGHFRSDFPSTKARGIHTRLTLDALCDVCPSPLLAAGPAE